MAEKKIYLNEIKIEEILERLDNGEKIYFDTNDHYVEMYNKYPVEKDKEGNLVMFNTFMYPQSTTAHFLNELEEPEADESCIGKLCKFWYEGDSPKDCIISILEEICEADDVSGVKYRIKGVALYEHCRPLTKEEVMNYIKE